MYKSLTTIIQMSLLALILSACGGNSNVNGSLTIEKDLTLSSISVDIGEFSPAFDSSVPGPYEFTVESTVESVDITLGDLADSEATIVAFRRVPFSEENRRGREDEQTVVSNQVFTISLDKGDNLIDIRVQTPDESQFLTYLISIRRVNDEARLAGIEFYTASVASVPTIIPVAPTSFSRDVFVYNLSVPFGVCTEGVFPVRSDRNSTITVNGELASSDVFSFVELNVGNNEVNIVVESEDKSTIQEYTLNIERAAETADDAMINRTLSQLSFTPGDLESGEGAGRFHCLLQEYNVRVNNNQTSVDISAAPTIAGLTVELGEVVVDDTTGVSTIENIVTLPTTLENVALGASNSYVVSLGRDNNDQLITHYTFRVIRSATNRVLVDDGLSLQAALQNAAPNQEIILADGNYTADATVAASGFEGVVFYSAASGTADMPIILRGLGNVDLQSSNPNLNTVFQLSGDYWDISNLRFSNAQTGVVLDAAKNNVFNLIQVSGISERGLVLRNESENNTFARMIINGTGREGLVVGSDASDWNTAPVAGPYEPANANNRFSNVLIGPNVNGELIDIKEGVNATDLSYMVLNSRDVDVTVAEEAAAVVLKGNDTVLSYNTFLHTSGSGLSSAIFVKDIDTTWVTEPWGEGNEVFDNIFDFSDATGIHLVEARADVDAVFVGDNVRSDTGEISYSGAGVDESFMSPVYQLQLSSDDSMCLERELVMETVTATEAELLVASECENVAAQHWDLINEGNGEVIIRSVEDRTRKIAPRQLGDITNFGIISLFSDTNTGIDESFFLRWVVNAVSNEEVIITNKFNPAFAITTVNLPDTSTFETDKAVAVMFQAPALDQRFKLVRVQ